MVAISSNISRHKGTLCLRCYRRCLQVTAAWLRMLNSEMQLSALLGLSAAELFGYKTVYNHEELSAIASTQYLNKVGKDSLVQWRGNRNER